MAFGKLKRSGAKVKVDLTEDEALEAAERRAAMHLRQIFSKEKRSRRPRFHRASTWSVSGANDVEGVIQI